MDISIDNHLSKHLLKTDNLLAPFHKSISCWAIVAFGVADIFSGAQAFNKWNHEDHLTQWVILMISIAGIFVSLLRYRLSLSQSIEIKRSSDEDLLATWRRMSSITLTLCGLALLSILLAFKA